MFFILQLSFVVLSNPRDGETKMNSSPDVQLVGNNTVLDFWAQEQPADPRIPFTVEIKLLPVSCQIFDKCELRSDA